MCQALSSGLAQGAEAPLVVLVRGEGGGPVALDALVRVKGELSAGGFRVQVVEYVKTTDPRTTVEKAGVAAGASAAVGIFAGSASGILEVWVAECGTGKSAVQRVDIASQVGDRAVSVLAVRTAELLRASLVDLGFSGTSAALAPVSPPRAPGAPPPAAANSEEARAAASFAGRAADGTWGAEAGLALLGSFGGLGIAWSPIVRVKLAPTPRFAVRLSGSGLGSEPSVEASTGVASVSQSVVMVDLVVRVLRGRWVVPFVSAGAGVYRVETRGSARWPYEGRSPSLVALVAGGGVGLGVRWSRRWEITMEVQALWARPYPSFVLVRREIATAGNPSLFGCVTLGGWL